MAKWLIHHGRQCVDDFQTDEAWMLHEIVHLLAEIRDSMATPTDPQTIIDSSAAALEQAGAALTAVGAALPALLAAGSGTPIDTSALVTQVTAVINASNAIVALLPAGTAPQA
jgi:hypothetical protein